ncbi:MAG TPA: hypothetical protein PK819_04690, partial [Thermomicrobiales bacterium]|nr:hypothetical protein [Thermomicrobiales bacterium]
MRNSGIRLIQVLLLTLSLISSGAAVRVGMASPQAPRPVIAAGFTGTTIYAGNLDGYDYDTCDPNNDGWHFVITGLSGNAPSQITVTWSTGASEVLPLDKVTGGTAHYISTTVFPFGTTVTSASATIVGDYGNFNLSHIPCYILTPTATNTVSATATKTTVSTSTSTAVSTATNTPVDTATNTPVDTATNT